jgi:4-hydroxybenzoate polyprenyltransferase
MENLDKVYANKIAEQYAPKTERKVVQLKKLDEQVKKPAKIFAYTFGIIGALILGTGMSFLMTAFGPSGTLGTVLGIVIGVIGIIMCGINYKIYSIILNKRKEKFAFEITTLAKEIANEE